MTFYGTLVSGAGWIVPKKYVERVGAGRLQEAPDRPRALQVRESHAGHRAGHGGVRELLAQDAVGEAARLQERPRLHHASGHVEAGEVDVAYLLEVPQAEEVKRDPDAEARLLRRDRLVLPGLPRPVGPEVALGRPARAARRELCDRSAGAERGGDARRLQAGGEYRPAQLRVRAAHRALPLRPGEGEAVAGRGRLPQRLRCRRAVIQLPPYFSMGEAITGYLGAVGIKLKMRPMERAAYTPALAAKKLQGGLRLRHRNLRQCRIADVGDRPERRRLRLRRLSRHRRAVQGAGAGDRPHEARGDCCTRSSSCSTSG